MPAARRLKISVSLDAKLVEALDRGAAREGTTRSATMERWLRRAARQALLSRLEEDTAAYYEALTGDEKADDRAWAEAASTAGRKLAIDGEASARERPGATRQGPTRSARRPRRS